MLVLDSGHHPSACIPLKMTVAKNSAHSLASLVRQWGPLGLQITKGKSSEDLKSLEEASEHRNHAKSWYHKAHKITSEPGNFRGVQVVRRGIAIQLSIRASQSLLATTSCIGQLP